MGEEIAGKRGTYGVTGCEIGEKNEQITEFAKIKKPLILESNFHEKELVRIHKIAKDNGY